MTVKVPPKGTRGVPFPRFLARIGNGMMVRRFRSVGGAARHPAWLYNLARQPEATLEFEGGRRVPVRAETLEGPQLEDAWARIAKDAPVYNKYRSKTDRDIPVLRLRQR